MDMNEDKPIFDLVYLGLHTILLIIIGLLIIQNLSIYLYFMNGNSEDYFSNYWLDIILYTSLALILGLIFLQTKIREYFISFFGFIVWVFLTFYWRMQLSTKIIPRDITDESTDWSFVKEFFLPYTSLLFFGSIFFLIGLFYLVKVLQGNIGSIYVTIVYSLSNLLATLLLYLFCLDPANKLVLHLTFMNVLFDRLMLFAALSYMAKLVIIPMIGIIAYLSIIFSQKEVNLIKYFKAKNQII